MKKQITIHPEKAESQWEEVCIYSSVAAQVSWLEK